MNLRAPPAAKAARRRSSAEIRKLILDAARIRFAAEGIEGATSRAIAEDAGVAEHLIFRHFQSKANLFEEAVITPFTAVFGEFLRNLDTDEGGVEFRTRTTVRALYRFLRNNSAFLQAIIKSSGQVEGKLAHALDGYFKTAEKRLRLVHEKPNSGFDVPPALFVRFAFGTVVSAVLLDSWFFPDHAVDEDAASAALARMVFKAMQPVFVPSDDGTASGESPPKPEPSNRR